MKDALMYRTLTTSGTSQQFPTGYLTSTGAGNIAADAGNFDEIDLAIELRSATPMVAEIECTSIGDHTSFACILQSDDNVAFSSPVTVVTFPSITAATVKNVAFSSAGTERYVRFAITPTGGASGGTFQCSVRPLGDSRYG